MNQTELSETIKRLSQELNAMIAASLTEQGMPALQQELIKSKCVALYDLLLKINTVSETETRLAVAIAPPVPPAVNIEKPKATPPLPVVDTPSAVPPPSLFNDLPQTIEEPLVEIAQEEIVTTSVTPPLSEKTETERQNEIIDEIIEIREEQKEKAEQSKEVINEISLHEKIASVLPPADLTDRFGTSITSLKSAINVNLKIALVNDLFNENTVDYVKSIDKLNNAANIDEAMRFYTELKHHHGWDNDNPLVRELESLISKRFS